MHLTVDAKNNMTRLIVGHLNLAAVADIPKLRISRQVILELYIDCFITTIYTSTPSSTQTPPSMHRQTS